MNTWRKIWRKLTERKKTRDGYQSLLTNIFMGGAMICFPVAWGTLLKTEDFTIFTIFSILGFSFIIAWIISMYIDKKKSPPMELPETLEGVIMKSVWKFIKKLFKP